MKVHSEKQSIAVESLSIVMISLSLS